jgi:hypothetical protein
VSGERKKAGVLHVDFHDVFNNVAVAVEAELSDETLVGKGRYSRSIILLSACDKYSGAKGLGDQAYAVLKNRLFTAPPFPGLREFRDGVYHSLSSLTAGVKDMFISNFRHNVLSNVFKEYLISEALPDILFSPATPKEDTQTLYKYLLSRSHHKGARSYANLSKEEVLSELSKVGSGVYKAIKKSKPVIEAAVKLANEVPIKVIDEMLVALSRAAGQAKEDYAYYNAFLEQEGTREQCCDALLAEVNSCYADFASQLCRKSAGGGMRGFV